MGECKTCTYMNGGQCRRNAPIAGRREPHDERMSYFREWPRVADDDTCGEYVRHI